MHSLGDRESSEALIRDLYLSLRRSVSAWSRITHQTPQARMGYVGQHLVSVVTGLPGGKSGARGYDLIDSQRGHGEIKTCYRVDQLGACRECKGGVSALETECAGCGSQNIARKDDSKWLLAVKTETDFANLAAPFAYYFVLFEFENALDPKNQNVLATIWEVDPTNLGFALCMVDYKLNIQSASNSSAPFNLWPYSLKFFLMEPHLIYKSIIEPENVTTQIFPSPERPSLVDPIPPLDDFSRARTLTDEALRGAALELGCLQSVSATSRGQHVEAIEQHRERITNSELARALSQAVYGPLLAGKLPQIPDQLLHAVPALRAICE